MRWLPTLEAYYAWTNFNVAIGRYSVESMPFWARVLYISTDVVAAVASLFREEYSLCLFIIAVTHFYIHACALLYYTGTWRSPFFVALFPVARFGRRSPALYSVGNIFAAALHAYYARSLVW